MNNFSKNVAIILLIAAGLFYLVGYSIDKNAISKALVALDNNIVSNYMRDYESVSDHWDDMNVNDKKEWLNDLFRDIDWDINAHNDLCGGVMFSKYSLEDMGNALLYVEELDKEGIDALYLKVEEAYKILYKHYSEEHSVDEIVDAMILVEDVFGEE